MTDVVDIAGAVAIREFLVQDHKRATMYDQAHFGRKAAFEEKRKVVQCLGETNPRQLDIVMLGQRLRDLSLVGHDDGRSGRYGRSVQE